MDKIENQIYRIYMMKIFAIFTYTSCEKFIKKLQQKILKNE